jgi:hypothetical protein
MNRCLGFKQKMKTVMAPYQDVCKDMEKAKQSRVTFFFTRTYLLLHHTLYIVQISARNTNIIPINTNANVIMFSNH